jgi:maltooligosyltrehalose synthase
LLETERLNGFQDTDRRKRKLREDLAYLLSHKLDLLKSGVYTPETMLAKEKRLENEIASLISNEVISEEAMRSTMKEIRKISELLNNLAIYWDFCEISEKEEITRIIFSELSLKEKTLSFKLNPGFKPFESRLVPFGAARRI